MWRLMPAKWRESVPPIMSDGATIVPGNSERTVRARPEDLPRFHGTNERISSANLAELVRFYHQLLRNAATQPAKTSVSP